MIVPGDTLSDAPQVLGPGVYECNNQAIPTVAGYLHTTVKLRGTVAYVDLASKHYEPHTNDMVVGVVVGSIGESFKVQIQDFCQPVLLNFMAFPNATKKNRPQLKNGQCVYARVSQAVPEIDVEIECVDAAGKDGGFGPLDEQGMVVDIANLAYCRQLLFKANLQVLERLAQKCKFEIAVGMNGKLWIKVGGDEVNFRGTIAAAKYLVQMQHHREEEGDEVLHKLWKEYQVDEQSKGDDEQ